MSKKIKTRKSKAEKEAQRAEYRQFFQELRRQWKKDIQSGMKNQDILKQAEKQACKKYSLKNNIFLIMQAARRGEQIEHDFSTAFQYKQAGLEIWKDDPYYICMPSRSFGYTFKAVYDVSQTREYILDQDQDERDQDTAIDLGVPRIQYAQAAH